MKVSDLLDKRSIDVNASPKSKKEAIETATDLIVACGAIRDREAFRSLVFARETAGSTGIGKCIAIPHGKGKCVIKPALAAMIIKNGVDFESADNERVHILFLIAAPDTEDNSAQEVMSKLAVLLLNEEFCQSIMKAESADEFLKIVALAENKERIGDNETMENNNLIAVTACPTGIAHTYMAAESLKKAAEKEDALITIEMRSADKAENPLSEEDIQNASCVIVSADIDVPMERFIGKKVLIRKISDGINKADELVALALSGNVEVLNEYKDAVPEKSGKGGFPKPLIFVLGGVALAGLGYLTWYLIQMMH